MKKSTEVSTIVSQEVLAQLNEAYPIETGYQRIQLPRLGMYSQDQVEGKGKTMKVIAEAGTFYTEEESKELDEDGKKQWDKVELGNEIEAVILYQRKQLKMYDESTEKYTSSQIYDDENQALKLWCDKKEIATGTAADLKKNYEYTDEKTGKIKSKLEENRILYVLLNDKVYQMNLRGSSMHSFLSYRRQVLPIGVITSFSSESMEKGKICWNQMKFEKVRDINAEEGDIILEKVNEIRMALKLEKSQFSEISTAIKEKALDDFAKGNGEAEDDEEEDLLALPRRTR